MNLEEGEDVRDPLFAVSIETFSFADLAAHQVAPPKNRRLAVLVAELALEEQEVLTAAVAALLGRTFL